MLCSYFLGLLRPKALLIMWQQLVMTPTQVHRPARGEILNDAQPHPFEPVIPALCVQALTRILTETGLSCGCIIGHLRLPARPRNRSPSRAKNHLGRRSSDPVTGTAGDSWSRSPTMSSKDLTFLE